MFINNVIIIKASFMPYMVHFHKYVNFQKYVKIYFSNYVKMYHTSCVKANMLTNNCTMHSP